MASVGTADKTYPQDRVHLVTNLHVPVNSSIRTEDANGNQWQILDKNVQFVSKGQVVALAGGTDTAGGLGSWVNPEAGSIIIVKMVIYVTVVATGACSIQVGTTAVSATTASANLIDTLDVHSATGVFDNITDKGSNGKSRQLLATGKWITFSQISGASAGLAATAYFEYIPV